MSSRKIIPAFFDQVDLGFSQKIPNFSFDINKIDNVIVCGMGGSALAAQFLKRFYPIHIHRNYDLPEQFLNQRTLIVCISYSGNTEEVISAYEIAMGRNLPVVTISSGGILRERAVHDKVPFIEVRSKGIEPRMAVVEQICILKNLLDSLQLNNNSLKGFEVSENNIFPKELNSNAKKIADTLVDKVPLIYASSDNTALAIYWKILFNESSKIPAFWNVFPEMNHNEIMQGGGGISWPEKLHIINLIDSDDHPKIQQRMEITKNILEKSGMGVSTVSMKDGSRFEKIINSIILGNLVSMSLAKNLGIDPIDPGVREKFKAMMAKTQ